MTTSRVIRGTKAKVFLYVCAILIITALIACYNNSLTQLEEVKKAYDVCHQQQENLSTQLQVISDYKLKLEKSLKSEKAEHQQSKNNLEIKINDEKNKSLKLANDTLLKYNSLKQYYNLLQTQHDDFKEESSKTQQKQLEEINSLQSKLKEIEEELKKVKVSKEHVKTQATELNLENTELKKMLQKANSNDSQQTIKFYSDEYRILEEKYTSLKEKCGVPEENPAHSVNGDPKNKVSEKSFLHLPAFKIAENPSSSTKSVLKLSTSGGQLNGAKPLYIPSATPESVKKAGNLKPPQGVVELPENRENQNEQPQVNRQNKIEKDDTEKENAAQEVFDAPINNSDGLLSDDGLKQNLNLDQKLNVQNNKKHDEQDYKDFQREEEDDDIDEYGDHHVRVEDIAERN